MPPTISNIRLLCYLFCAGSVLPGAEILPVSGEGQRQFEQGVMWDLLRLMPSVVWAGCSQRSKVFLGGRIFLWSRVHCKGDICSSGYQHLASTT